MGFVSGLLGTSGGAGGSGFSAPASVPIQKPTTDQQASDAYKANQNALSQQQSFLNATQAQNGLGNQSNVYNQLQGVVNGIGPNPAQAQLAQATGANVANQAALMAGQRGANANVGLLARQAAQQGANTQQQAAGQAATLQAQQSLNALSGAGNIANTQAAQQAAATTANTQAQQNEQQQLLNSIAQQNNSAVGMQSNVNNANAGLAQTTMQGQQGILGGAANGLGSVFGLAEGGEIPVSPAQSPVVPQGPPPPQSSFTKFLKGFSASANPVTPSSPPADQGIFNMAQTPGAKALQQGVSNIGKSFAPKTMDQELDAANYAEGGKVPAMVSPGEKYLAPKDVKAVEQGANPMEVGEKIPGKPKVGGAKNDYSNDTVPKTLEEGGIVLPRSVTQSKHPHWAAHAFVRDIMAKQGKSMPKKPKVK